MIAIIIRTTICIIISYQSLDRPHPKKDKIKFLLKWENYLVITINIFRYIDKDSRFNKLNSFSKEKKNIALKRENYLVITR